MRSFLTLGLAVILCVAVASCSRPTAPQATIRFRVEIALSYFGEIYKSSAVWEMTAKWQDPLLNSASGINDSFRGEALVFQINNGDTIFALRRFSGKTQFPNVGPILSGCVPGSKTSAERISNISTMLIDCHTQNRNIQLAKFFDLNDPKTLQPIATGGNVYVRDIHLTTTNDEITDSIHRTIPWISRSGGNFNIYTGEVTNYILPYSYYSVDFTTELN